MLIEKHNQISEEWSIYCDQNDIDMFNQKRVQVIDFQENKYLYSVVKEYIVFLIRKDDLMDFFNKINVRWRIKTVNSVHSKISKYINNNIEKGRVPVFKCLNDVIGTRIITENEFSFEEINSFIEKNYNGLKCISASKNGYKATHIYFKTDNKHFQWELQIWSKNNEISNIKSHIKHKEAYADWENEKPKIGGNHGNTLYID